MKKTFVPRLLGMLALLGATTAQAGLITNGGFEAEPDPSQGWTLSGNTSLVFFDGVAPRSGLIGASFGSAPAAPSWLSQSLDTTAGARYELRFWLQNGQPGSEEEPNFFELNWDGGAPELLLANADAFGYQEYSYRFTASGENTELRFGFANYLSFWDLDDVSVSAVPAPSALALLGAGLLAAGLAGRRRRA